MESNIVLGILLLLTIIVILIYIKNQNVNLEYFQGPVDNIAIPLNNIALLPASDIHFILDNTASLIETPVLNYKLTINNSNTSNSSMSNSNSSMSTMGNMGNMANMANMANMGNNDTIDNFENTISNGSRQVYLSVFQHKAFTDNYKGLCQYVKISDTPLDETTAIADVASNIKAVSILTSSSINPVRYNLIWTSDINQDGQIFSVWHPVPPAGAACLGDVIVSGTDTPDLDYIKCIPITMLTPANISNGIIWSATNDMGRQCFCWGAGNINQFRCSNIYNQSIPELNTVYNLPSEYLKQNTLLSNAEQSSKGVKV
uniref:Uncharacterized protein n=1 Tax=viral metagenome TaxID=1070528 RepID=A0A6C0EY65_9ZZZZ